MTLRARQQAYLEKTFGEKTSIFAWTNKVSDPISCAVVIANEVIDALPVRLLSIQKGSLYERCVRWSNEQRLEFVSIDADETLTNLAKERLSERVIWQSLQPYDTEICTRMPSFIQQITSFVKQGVLFFIDYGYPRKSTIMCNAIWGRCLSLSTSCA